MNANIPNIGTEIDEYVICGAKTGCLYLIADFAIMQKGDKMFEMHDLNIICPKCGNPNYMRLMSGANVGKLNVVCTNCNSYFAFNDLEKCGEMDKMDNTNWYRISKDIILKNGKTVKVYQTVFETSDYSLSEDCVDWCMKAMDRKNAERRQDV